MCAVKIAPLDDVRTKNEINVLAAGALPSEFVVRSLAAHEDHLSSPRAFHADRIACPNRSSSILLFHSHCDCLPRTFPLFLLMVFFFFFFFCSFPPITARLWIAYELAELGSIRRAIKLFGSKSESVARGVVFAAAHAVRHLHDVMQIAHGNIDDSHLLLFANGDVKLCGFGAAAALTRSEAAASTLSGGFTLRGRESERKVRTLSLGATTLQQQPSGSSYSGPMPSTANWTLAANDVSALGALAVALAGRGGGGAMSVAASASASGALHRFQQQCGVSTVAMASIGDVLESDWLRLLTRTDARDLVLPLVAAAAGAPRVALAAAIRDGVARRRRYFRMAPFEDAFDGQQAVDWVCATLGSGTSRDAALAELQTLQYRGVLRHVLNAGDMHDAPTHIYQLAPTGQRAPTARELRALVQRLCDADTRLAASDRRVRLRVVANCVTGAQVLDWVRRYAPAHVSAAEAADELLQAHVLVPTEPVDALAPEQPLSDRALYRVAHGGAPAELLALLDAVPPRIALSAELVRETVQKACAPTSGVPREVRKGVLCCAASQLVTWLGRQHEALTQHSRRSAVLLARALARRGAWYDVELGAKGGALISDTPQQWVRFCADDHDEQRDVDAARVAALERTRAALMRGEAPPADEQCFHALLWFVQTTTDGALRRAAAGAILARCFGAKPSEPVQVNTETGAQRKQRLARIGAALTAPPGDAQLRLLSALYQSGAFGVLYGMAHRFELTVHTELLVDDVLIVPASAPLARGATATVLRGYVVGERPLSVAVKRFCEGDAPLAHTIEFRREVTLLSLVRHACIAECVAARTLPPAHCTVSPLCENGTVEAALLDRARPLPWSRRLLWASDVAEALAFMHATLHALYRDVKSSNVLLNGEMRALLCDFGAARTLPTTLEPRRLSKMPGTVAWMAPEQFANELYGDRADVYAYGVFLWELAARATPFADLLVWEIPDAVLAGTRPPLPAHTPFAFAQLVRCCWNASVALRPDMRTVATRVIALIAELQLSADETLQRARIDSVAAVAGSGPQSGCASASSDGTTTSNVDDGFSDAVAFGGVAADGEMSSGSSSPVATMRRGRAAAAARRHHGKQRRPSASALTFDLAATDSGGGSESARASARRRSSLSTIALDMDQSAESGESARSSAGAGGNDDSDEQHSAEHSGDSANSASESISVEPSGATPSTPAQRSLSGISLRMSRGGAGSDHDDDNALELDLLENDALIVVMRGEHGIVDAQFQRGEDCKAALARIFNTADNLRCTVLDGATGEVLGSLHDSLMTPFDTHVELSRSGVVPVYSVFQSHSILKK
jgi:serine/threonine protein kinase